MRAEITRFDLLQLTNIWQWQIKVSYNRIIETATAGMCDFLGNNLTEMCLRGVSVCSIF